MPTLRITEPFEAEGGAVARRPKVHGMKDAFRARLRYEAVAGLVARPGLCAAERAIQGVGAEMRVVARILPKCMLRNRHPHADLLPAIVFQRDKQVPQGVAGDFWHGKVGRAGRVGPDEAVEGRDVGRAVVGRLAAVIVRCRQGDTAKD